MEVIVFSLLVFSSVLVLVPLLRPLAFWMNHVDRPGGRKLHTRAIPLSGGTSIGSAVIVAGLLFSGYPKMGGLAAGVLTLLVLGKIDDRFRLPALIRIFGEAAIVLTFMCLWEGVTLESLGSLTGEHREVVTGAMALAITVFAGVGVINSINMIDGVDGLAGGFTVLALGIFVAAATLEGSQALGIMAFLMAGVIAFLAYNMRTPWRHSASVFLGDGGSLSLGFALMWFAVDLSQGEAAILRPITMVWIFGLPLADTISLMLRRLLQGQSPLKADLRHLHHLLLLLGLSPGRTTAVWLAMAASSAAVGLIGEMYGIADVAMFSAYGFAFLVYFVASLYIWRRFGSKEMDAAEIADG